MRTPTAVPAAALALAGLFVTAGPSSAGPTTSTGDPSPEWTATYYRSTTADPGPTSAPTAAPATGTARPRPTEPRRASSSTGTAVEEPLIETLRAPVVLPERVRPATGAGTPCSRLHDGIWTVHDGDTLWRIALCTGTDVDRLVDVNDLLDGGRLIFPGDRITLP